YTLNSPTGDNWTYTAATLKYDCYNYPIGRTGDFVIEPINLSTITNPRLTFDVAHRSYSAANPENDKLEVFISTNCGSTWTSIFSKQGTTLSTGPTQTSVFTPASAADWRNESVSLASYASQNQVFFKFVGTSAFGNNMYVDNINVSSLSSIESNELASSSVYPNPASTEVNVSFEAKGGEYKISITDLVGRTVANEVVANATGSTLVTMSTADLKAGNYLVTITNGSTTYTQNLMVK
ncbi:MAG: T9SS type A sorting domain-containing protein, partial [Fluviicola sp.]